MTAAVSRIPLNAGSLPGHLETARYLAGRGADINWRAPWSSETPLDAALDEHQRAVVAWLTESGAATR